MTASGIAETPEPPYVAVIFTSTRTEGDHGYAAMAEAMESLAAQQPGYLGIETVRDTGAGGEGITVSYWRDRESASAWKENAAHLVAQRRGREEWYADYRVRIAVVEHDYGPGAHALPTETTTDVIQHLTTRAEWERALAEGTYRNSTRGKTLDEVGFIHGSLPHQLAGVAHSFYADCPDDLVVLEMPASRLEAGGVPVRFEDDGAGMLFPHLYAPLPCHLVESVRPAAFDEDGRFTLGT